jgi:hypothetical protein
VIDSVDISCPSAGTVDVVVRTRTDAVVSNRSTDARLYLDFTDAAATRRGATPPSKTAAHAAELAASGNVRELLKLIDTLSPSQRAAIDGEGPTLADLLEQARARQLQRDRDLLLRASRASQ